LETVAVSFTKGCYLGQEVMARLHAMGQVRRRLVRVAGDGPAPSAGASLRHAADDKRAGELRAAVDDGRGGWIGLAMVNLLGLDPARALKLGPETAVGAGWSVVLRDLPEAGA
jgi:folate-binding Fe-S cluster repair protein YgfZ